jgi:hypothetical protein
MGISNMRRLLLGLLLLATPAWADQRVASYMVNFNASSATLTYCRATGRLGDPYGGPQPGNNPIKTSGSSTTVTTQVANGNPFLYMVVGDVIFVTRPTGVTDTRVVVTRTDANNITVDTAVDWSTQTNGFAFTWYHIACGTTANDGWIDVAGYPDKTIVFQYDQGDATTGVDVRFECRAASPQAAPVQVYPSTGFTNYPTPGIGARTALVIYEPWSACRVGFKIDTTLGVQTIQLNAMIMVNTYR